MVTPPQSPVTSLYQTPNPVSINHSIAGLDVRGRISRVQAVAAASAIRQQAQVVQETLWEEVNEQVTMRGFLLFAAFLLVHQPCTSRSVNDEESVVSVYTTLPTAAGTGAPLDVYRQIADNIAERITQPIYRFFGIGNSTSEEKTTKRPFEHIELGSPELPPKTNKNDPNISATSPNISATGPNLTATDSNEIPDRDVEELSLDSIQKSDKKPEKFTLFSSYLPVKENLELNDTKEINDNNIDSNDNSLELDDVDNDDDEKEKGREGPFVYILEFVGSVIQLLWGGFLALFRPSSSTSS